MSASTGKPDLADLRAFMTVAEAGGFRDAARLSNASASGLSEAVRRLESALGVRLLHRTTRSVQPTEAGIGLIARLRPALAEVDAAVDAVGSARDQPAGRLRLNVPVSAARLVLPAIVPGFLAAFPDIRLEVVADDNFVDLVASGADAGIRFDERLEADMVAVPIGPRRMRTAAAASPAYLAQHGRPAHPRDLLAHRCLRFRFASGASPPWEFERDGEVLRVDPTGPLLVEPAGTVELLLAASVGGAGIVGMFEEWLRPHLASGALEPVLEAWWQVFPGMFLYYPGRRLMPAPLRAFVDFVRARPAG